MIGFFGLFSFGVLGVILYLVNTTIIGLLLGLFKLMGYAPVPLALAGILPHGIFEVPALLLSCAVILQSGLVLVTPQAGRTVGEVLIETACRLGAGDYWFGHPPAGNCGMHRIIHNTTIADERHEHNKIIMTKIFILGSANAIADKDHANTHMVIAGRERVVLVDCPANPILRLERVGLEFNGVTDLIITHFHPDHVSGVPNFLMEMWLMGRKSRLTIFGLDYTIDRLEKMMDLFGWDRWPGFYPVSFTRLPADEMTLVLNCPDYTIYSSPVKHLIPTIGLRVEFPDKKIFAYSSDTEPCEQVVRLAANADVLIHESSGATDGHSSAGQAGEIAERAEVAHLFLIHYPNRTLRNSDLISDAGVHFLGTVSLAEDFTTLEF